MPLRPRPALAAVALLLATLSGAGPPQAAATVPPSELRRLLLQADVVVVGTVTLGACLDGCVGQIAIRESLVGAIDGPIGFRCAAPTNPELGVPMERVLFLARDWTDNRRWSALLTSEGELGLPAGLREAVVSLRIPRASSPSELKPVAEALAELRALQPSARASSSRATVAAAREVFSNVDFRGLTAKALVELLGEPSRRDEVDGHRVLNYAYTGTEASAVVRFVFDEGRVIAVRVL